MNFNDILESNNNSIRIIKEIEPIINQLKSIIKLENELLIDTLNSGFKTSLSLVDPTGAQNVKELSKDINLFGDKFIKKCKEIKILSLGKAIYKISNINFIRENNFLDNIELLGELVQEITLIEEYTGGTDDLIVKTFRCIKELVYEYDYFIRFNQELNKVNNMLSNGYDPKEDKLLNIRLLTHNNGVDDAMIFFEHMKKIYSDICLLGNINIEEYPLTYERLESGSLMAWLNGNVAALTIMGGAIVFIYNLYKDNLSSDSKMKNINTKVEILEKGLNITKQLEDAGCNVEREYEDIHNINGRIIKEIDSLIKKSPTLEVNGQILTLDSNERIAFLQNISLLEQSSEVAATLDEED